MRQMPPTKCQSATKDDSPCNAYAVAGSAYCYHHDPERADERRLARRRGGFHRHGRRIGSVGQSPTVSLDTMVDVARLLQGTINDALQLENSLQRARTIGYLAALLIKALDIAVFEERIAQLERTLKLREKPK